MHGKMEGRCGAGTESVEASKITTRYGEVISGYFREQYASAELPAEKLAGPVQRLTLRYGANPHQKIAQAYVSKGELPFKSKWFPVRRKCGEIDSFN